MPALQINTVVVSGAQTVSSSTIEQFVRERLAGSYGHILPKSDIFLYPKRDISTALKAEYPLLASAEVYAVDFHTIAVALVERSPRALWCPSSSSTYLSQGSCYFMDENGVIYAEAPHFSEPVYTSYRGPSESVTLPRQYLQPGEFLSLSALVDAIMQKISAERLEEVEVDAQSDVRMRFADGCVLIFALHDEGGDVFERFSLALQSAPFAGQKLSQFEYLDLRFGDKLYYKENK